MMVNALIVNCDTTWLLSCQVNNCLLMFMLCTKQALVAPKELLVGMVETDRRRTAQAVFSKGLCMAAMKQCTENTRMQLGI